MNPGTETLDLAHLRVAVRSVCENRPIVRVEVFGSMSGTTMHPASDIDLLIEFDPDAPVGLFEMGEIKEELESRLGRRVDLLSRPAIERSKNSFRRRSILAQPLTVYAR